MGLFVPKFWVEKAHFQPSEFFSDQKFSFVLNRINLHETELRKEKKRELSFQGNGLETSWKSYRQLGTKRDFFLFQSVLAKFIDEVEKLKSKKNVRSCHNKNQATKNVLGNVNNQKRKRASVSCSSFLESHDGKSVIPNTGDDKNLTERVVNWIKFNAALVAACLQGKNAKDTFAITVRNQNKI